MPRVQTYATQKIANSLSKQLNTEITIEGVNVSFFNNLILENFLVKDQKQDTLAYFKELRVGVRYFNRELTNISFGKVNLINPVFNIYSIDSTRFNYSFIQEQFQSDSESSEFKTEINISSIKLQNGIFSFHNYNYEDSNEEVNYNHVDVSSLNLFAKKTSINDTILKSDIKRLALIEANGFDLEKLATEFTLKEGLMRFDELIVQTFSTDLYADYAMYYDSIAHFLEFIDKVKIKSSFRSSLIDVKDLAFFVPPFKGIENKVNITGDIGGYISNLKGRNLAFQVDEETFFKGKFDLRGLPDVESCYMYFKIQELKTNARGLKKLPYPPFEENNYLTVDDNLYTLGDIRFNGEFTGFYNDFVAYGDFTTALGSIKTDIELNENQQGEFEYLGEIKSERFGIGKFIEFNNLSELALDVIIDGNGLTFYELDAEVIGSVDYLVLNDYRYNELELNGRFLNEKFTGEISLDDENLSFDFKGLIDVNKKKPVSKFKLNLYKSNLAKLNLFRQYDSLTQLSFQAELNLKGYRIDEIEGEAMFKELTYKDSKLNHSIDSLNLFAEGNKLNRNIRLRSDILDAELKGAFEIVLLPKTIKRFIQEYIPDAEKDEGFVENQNFRYSFLIKNAAPITDVFIPELSVKMGTELYGRINTESKNSSLILNCDELSYDGYSVSYARLDLGSKVDQVFSELSALGVNIKGTEFGKFINNNTLKNGDFQSEINWSTLNKRPNSGDINIAGKFYDYDHLDLSFIESSFVLQDSVWSFNDSNKVKIVSNSFEFNKLSLSNGNQLLDLNGKISDAEDTLQIHLEKLDLSYISTLLPEGVLKLSGEANGTASLRNFYNDLSLTSDLRMNDLEVNDTRIGEAKLFSTWNPKEKALIVDANLGGKTEKVLALTGVVYPLNDLNSLDLQLQFKETPIDLLKPYLTDILSDLEGSISGAIDITGEADKPILNGGFNLNQAKFRIDYLNTSYSINDRIIVQPDFIGFNLIKIKDENGQDAIATGTIFHNNYSDFNLDIGLEVNKFLALKTNSKQNDLYYGNAIVTGDANIAGYADQLILELSVATEKGTDFNIPITDGVEVSDSDYLIFTNNRDTVKNLEEVIDLTGIQMNFDLEISPDAKVQIIFDEQVGDVMRGKGSGNLKLEINTLGNFNIFGEYVVQDGDYLFTLQNVINKKFDIASGSRISWDGDPYDAAIDIKAIYNLRAALYDLMPEDTTANLRRRVPVELELQMTNKLLSPDIDFDIQLPSSDDRVRRRLESILYVNSNDKNRQELNQQVFGLLVLNRFLPPASGVTTETGFDRGTPGVNNGYEFLSNQLSNWLSKISDQFDIGVNYRPGDEITNDELDLSLSTEVFNDRLVLDGNLGYTSDNTAAENQNNSNFIGEFSAEYKLNKDGRLRVRGFNRSTNNNLLQNVSPYTQGVGLFYREEFTTFQELWRYYFRRSLLEDND